MKRKSVFILLRLLVGIGLLSFLFLFKKISWGEILNIVREINIFYIAFIFLISFFLIGISCFKWQILLRYRGIKVGLLRLIMLYIIGYCFNNFMPGSVGGDAIRGFVLGKRIKSQVESFASVFMERYTGFIALVGVSLAVSLINYEIWKEPRLASLLILVFIILLLSLLLIFNRKIFDKVKESILLKRMGKIREKLVRFYEAIHSFRSRKVMASALLISLIFHLTTSVNVLVVSLGLGLDVRVIDVFLVVPLILLVSMIPVSIAAWGVWEGAFVYFLGLVGVSAPEALSLALILRAKNLIVALMGGIIFNMQKGEWSPQVNRKPRPTRPHF